MRASAIDRFTEKIVINLETECWEWQGCKGGDGYGQFRVDGKKVLVHRWIYARVNGKIPLGLECDHKCNNPACVAPYHLQAVTRTQNEHFKVTRDGTDHNVNKTHCPQGHEYAGANLIIRPQGWRECRECKRQRQRASYQRRREGGQVGAKRH